MEVTKYGETYNIKDTRDTYIISGDLIKTVNGDVIINVGTTTLDDQYLSSLNGNYRITDGSLSIDFRTSIANYDTQVEIIDLVIKAIQTKILN